MRLEALFFAGEYTKVIGLALGRRGMPQDSEGLAVVGAAYAAVGAIEESDRVLQRLGSDAAEGRGLVQYHLVLAALARESFLAARRYLGQMAAERAGNQPRKPGLWLAAAFARYRLVVGDIGNAMVWAGRCRKALADTGTGKAACYAGMVLHDIEAQCALLTGDHDQAHKAASAGMTMARSLKRRDSGSTLWTVRAVADARRGANPNAAVDLLTEKLDTAPDPWSATSLRLEACRLLIAAGNIQSARRELRSLLAAGVGQGGRRFGRATAVIAADLLVADGRAVEALASLLMLAADLKPDEGRLLCLEVRQRLGALAARGLRSAEAAWIDLPPVGTLVRRTGVKRALPPAYWQSATPDEMPVPAQAGRPVLDELNFRQTEFLKRWPRGQPASVHDYRLLVGTSEITACRDLAGLLRLGLVMRTGKARTTRYLVRSRTSCGPQDVKT